MNLKESAKKLKKIIAGITAGYALSPIDFIPVLGYLDDVILPPALIAFTINSFPLMSGNAIALKQRICGITADRKSGITHCQLLQYGC